MSNSFDDVAAKLAIQPDRCVESPRLAMAGQIPRTAPGLTLPVPPGNRLFWRLNEVTLLDNFDGVFDRRNEVNLIAVTVDSNVADPIKFQTPNVFPAIRKGDRLPLGDRGLGMYLSTPAQFPEYISLHLLIMEDDQDIRDAGKVIAQVIDMPEYKSILSTATTLASAANPLYGTLLQVGNSVVGLIAKLMEQNRDDLVAYFAATYTLAFDNLGVGKHTFFQEDRARVQYEILATQ